MDGRIGAGVGRRAAALVVTATLGCAAAGAAQAQDGAEGGPSFRAAEEPAAGPGGEEGKPPKIQISALGFYGGTPDASGYVAGIEGDFAVAKRFGIVAALLNYGYEWDNGEDLAPGNEAEEEEGSGSGLGAEFRVYTGKEALSGFYVGAGFSLFLVAEWEFKGDSNLNGVYEPSEIEDGDEVVFETHFTLGFSIPIGRHFRIAPALILGNFFSSSPEGGPYAGVGLRIGGAF